MQIRETWGEGGILQAYMTIRSSLTRALRDSFVRKAKYKAAKHRALARKPFLKTDGHYLSREQTHNREGLRTPQLRQHQ